MSKRSKKIRDLLQKMEDTFSKKEISASLGDYIRLVQLYRELEEEEPKEVKVTWVDPDPETEKKKKDA